MQNTEQLCAKTLGQIALIQGMVSHLPDNETIMRFVCRGLVEVPGSRQVTYCLSERTILEEQAQEAPRPPGCFPLKFHGAMHGELVFHIADHDLFSAYVPYLKNLSLALGVVFEERHQRRMNEAYRDELEQRVSERTRQLEKEVEEHKRSRNMLDAIINNTRNVICVKDPTGRYTLVNNRFCEIFELDRSRILGRRAAELFPGHAARQHEENDRTVAARKEPVTFNEYADLADGRHEYISIKFPLLDEAGSITAIGDVSTDITSIKAVTDALRLDEARLEALLALFQMDADDMTDITDFALEEAIKLTKSEIGYLAFTNEDESVLTMYSWSKEAMKQCSIKNRRIEYKVAETGLWGEAIRQRKPIVTNDYPGTPESLKKGYPQGHVHLMRHMNVPVFDGNRIVAVAGVGNKNQDYDEADVRQLRLLMQGMWPLIQRMQADKDRDELESRLQQAYKMESIGTLAGGIAHDFNNILSAIFGYTELSMGECEPGTFIHSSLRSIMEAAKRAKDLVGHILTFSRQGEYERIPVEVLPIVREVARFIRASLPASIEIQQNLKDAPMILADPTQFHQVVMNLCTNAGHAMDGGGGVLNIELRSVELDAEFCNHHPGLAPGAHIRLTVTDTGSGIPPELIDRIFDPYFTTKERGKGTGMGLSVVHGIVKSLGGAITVYSSPVEGSSFNVFIPAIERRSAQPQRPEKPIPMGTERILFVDDEEALVQLGITMLGSLGYRVTGVCSSTEAVTLFNAGPKQFDLIITDLTMPKISGVQLAREIMLIRPGIPIILCTGFSATMDESATKSMGIKALINKPILKRQIAEAIRKVLDSDGSVETSM